MNETTITEKNEEEIYDVVNRSTGEIVDQIVSGTGDKIVHKEKDEKRKQYIKDHNINFNSGVPYVKLFKGMNELRKYLTTAEFTIAISLSDYVCYDDCIIRRGGTHKGKILTIKELAEDMDIEYDSLRRTITSLVKKGILGIHKTGCKDKPDVLIKTITVNPSIYARGVDINKTATGLFENSNWNNR